VPHLDTALLLAEGLARLRDFAIAGDAAAMRLFGSVLSQAVADLGEMARRKKPEVVREWSRKQNVVPVLTGKNAAQTGTKKDVGQLRRDLDDFDVGALSPYKINPAQKRGGGTFNATTRVNTVAGGLIHHLGNYRYSTLLMARPVPPWAQLASLLPELTKATATQWAKAAWECLMSATGSQPEKFLPELGQHRANHYERNVMGRLRPVKQSTKNRDLRDGVEGLLARAILGIAAESSSVRKKRAG